ncbi:hypothetical protein GCM10009096_03780 [Parasphingorhabdus litoris]|uniref:Uncharacterized protein n=1 Tax=Parasphingorhabdus litoris TaxID=394733 RepID=A0ABN1A324_9SPHN|nr:hypothetical protein [Parasphingorhabdus litoris]
MKSILTTTAILLAAMSAGQAKGKEFSGTIGLQATVSETIKMPSNRGRFNTRFLGAGGLSFADETDLKLFTFSCIGQDTTQDGSVVELKADCELRSNETSAIFASFDPALSRFIVTGGEGDWAGAAGFFTAEYKATPPSSDGHLMFFSTLKGEITQP